MREKSEFGNFDIDLDRDLELSHFCVYCGKKTLIIMTRNCQNTAGD